MTSTEFCATCPHRAACGQLKRALVAARPRIDGDTSGRELEAYYGALIRLQEGRWLYPHNRSKCAFTEPRTEIEALSNRLMEASR